MEKEDKINTEKATVNLNCLKEKLEENEFAENQYRIALTYENVFGDSLRERRENIDSLIGFLDHDVIMETVKLEDVKDEDCIRKIINQSYCSGCGGNYEGYCLSCSSLCHILNNITLNKNPESDLNTTPIDILEIREISMRRGIFALKTIPKGIILGPLEGIAPIEGINGFKWKIKDKRLANDQNSNWMKYIEHAANSLLKNLDIFQFDGCLYFKTSKEIQKGEELLVCYHEGKEVLKSDNHEESYLVPVVKEEFPKLFACTLCCLGFRLKRCLVEHKKKCPQGDHSSSIKDFKILQCHFCKVWLEKREHLKGHILHCWNNYKLRHNILDFKEINEISTRFDESRSSTIRTDVKHSKYSDRIGNGNRTGYFNKEKHKSPECSYQTIHKGHLNKHLNTHSDVKQFECDCCKKKFHRKFNLTKHIKNLHSISSEKEYQCSEYYYQTSYKHNYNTHLNKHNDIKLFECGFCKKRFTHKGFLKRHEKNQHSNTSEKYHKCSECPYQTKYKNILKQHLIVHSGVKSFECDICKKRFALKHRLKIHIRNQHSNTSEKKHKCSECPYQTNNKGHLKDHFNTHSQHSGIKNYECDICKKRYTQEKTLKTHIRDKHSNTSEKKYKCHKCSYQTNDKSHLKRHLNIHSVVKPFQCDICKKRFSVKNYLKIHIKKQHTNTSEKEYKCTKCSYQTNWKGNLKLHLNAHSVVFECGICKKRFTQKSSLKTHIKNQHTNTSEKD